jgi:cytoskeleton protein RodZ
LPVDMTNFGASLKKARESKGISLDQIAKETRISTRFLTAIENEEFHVLPGGVFNRGFVRTFAERVGLDPDQMVADYERLVSPREPPPAEAAPTANAQAPRSDQPKGDRRLFPIALGILALAIVVFYVVSRESNQTAETTSSSSPPVVSTPPVQTPAPAPAPEPPAETTPPPVPQEASPPAPSTPAPSKPAANTQALTLDIAVTETTWIKVQSDGNSVIPGEILEPGMTRKFTAENSIYISVGNAAGLTLKINDKPLKPLGKSGQVRSVTITPATLKDFIG